MHENFSARNNIYNLPKSFIMSMEHNGGNRSPMPGLVHPSSFRGSWIAVDFIDFLKESASAGIPWPALLLHKVVADMVREETSSGTLVCYMKYAHMLKVLFIADDEEPSGNNSHSVFTDGKGYLEQGTRITRPIIIRPVAFWDDSEKATAIWPAGPDDCSNDASNPMVLDAGNFLDYSSLPLSRVPFPSNVDKPGSDQMTIPLGPVSMFEYDGLLYVHRNRWFSYPD